MFKVSIFPLRTLRFPRVPKSPKHTDALSSLSLLWQCPHPSVFSPMVLTRLSQNPTTFQKCRQLRAQSRFVLSVSVLLSVSVAMCKSSVFQKLGQLPKLLDYPSLQNIRFKVKMSCMCSPVPWIDISLFLLGRSSVSFSSTGNKMPSSERGNLNCCISSLWGLYRLVYGFWLGFRVFFAEQFLQLAAELM